MKQVRWKSIRGYPGHEISSDGRIRRCYTSNRAQAGYELKQQINSKGYHSVQLSVNGICTNYRVNQLVCEHFNGPRPSPRHFASYRNGNRSDNRASNLVWRTPGEIARSYSKAA